MSKPETVTIKRPDDMHLHVRQGKGLDSVVPMTARQFGRAIIMPNTIPFIRTVDEAAKYRDTILAASEGMDFEPLMTLYLQTTTSPDTIRAAKKSGFIHGLKMYPQGGTTNSEGGIVNVKDVEEQLRVMEEVDIVLQIHGESADASVDVFRREDVFYNEAVTWIVKTFPKLRISFEHVTTKNAVEMIEMIHENHRIGATFTPQHLMVDRNYMLGGNLRPHAFCKPILKTAEDQQALLKAATSGNPRFFLGTDSAPHPQNGLTGKAKEGDCGCAGCFTAHAAMELYAEVFDNAGQLDRLDDFASRFGAEFYELPQNDGEIILERKEWMARESYNFGEGTVVPFRQEVPLQWKMVE
jgi:dihydroorotase